MELEKADKVRYTPMNGDDKCMSGETKQAWSSSCASVVLAVDSTAVEVALLHGCDTLDASCRRSKKDESEKSW